MNELLGSSQPSSESWNSPIPTMLHERQQSMQPHTYLDQPSIFDEVERQMAEHEEEFRDVLSTLKRLFIFNDPTTVETFLREHRSVAPVLLEAQPHLKASFCETTPLALETMPEEGSSSSLYALALWRGDRAESRSALRTFDDSWLIQKHEENGQSTDLRLRTDLNELRLGKVSALGKISLRCHRRGLTANRRQSFILLRI